ncbi:MAG TPA: DUF4245 domain-containing protein [Mycobacterium sp.]|nr:DUF4245 domain-containing protein [Mycobacterium sp.]HZA11694.1 DUF4245 domain-containing protein [Mycobacterium sp.]
MLQDGRDMFWSMVPLVVACIALAGVLGMCSFQLSGPRPGPAPTYDAAGALKADAAALGFPIRLPLLPAGWHANSGQRGAIEARRSDPATGQRVRALTSRVGYLAPSGRYLSLTQSDADEEKLVGSLGGLLQPTGTQNIGGVGWVVYEGGEGTESVWTTRMTGPSGATQIAMTGAGSPEEFRTLAAATQSQPPLSR